MLAPKFVCGVSCAIGFALSVDDDALWDMRSIV
jgi:hypothetical protein